MQMILSFFSDTTEDLQRSLDLLLEYCNRWKLKINVSKTKIMMFRKGGIFPRNLIFYYDGIPVETVKKFKYLGLVSGSFAEAQNT